MAKSNKRTWIHWSEDDVNLLKKLFPKGKARQVADQTGRTLDAVKQRAYDMGLKTRGRHLWSEDEIKLLHKLYQNQTGQSIADIPGRPMHQSSASSESLSLMSSDELPTIISNLPGSTANFCRLTS
jgi:hypothetical protein